MGEEHQNDQKNCGYISPEELRLSGTRNPIIVNISTVCYLVRRVCVRGSVGNDLGYHFALSFLRKEKNLSPIVGALSTMPVKKSELGLLNTVTSSQEKYLSYQRGSAELVQAVTGGGEFSNADHLQTLGEERRERKKDRDAAYKTKLKGLVCDLKGTNTRLIPSIKSQVPG